MPDGGYYGTGDLSADITIETINALDNLWECTSAISHETGLEIEPSEYTIAPSTSGASISTSAPGIYHFVVHSLFDTFHFTLVMGTPEISLEPLIYTWEIGCVTAEPYGLPLETGVYHFEVVPTDSLFFFDYSLPFELHLAFDNFFNTLGETSELVDYTGTPDPNGQVLKVTITQPGLYCISGFVTSPVFPTAQSPLSDFEFSVCE